MRRTISTARLKRSTTAALAAMVAAPRCVSK
jgi:hypothetical protein